MKKKVALFLLESIVFLMITRAEVLPRYQYVVTPDTVGKYLNVELAYTLTSQDKGGEVLLKMPVWAPGYYLIVDFPKYLTDFSVKDASGGDVPWRKEGKNAWRISAGENESLKVSYRIFSDARSVAECRVEGNVAFVAPNGVFMYAEGQKNEPVDVTYVLPDNWKNASTGLKRINDEEKRPAFRASDFDVLYDSPVLLGDHLVRKFVHEGHEYEFAFETPIGYEDSPFEGDFRKMVSAATQMMGHVPYDNYCLIHLGKGRGGLEHSNSQACYTDGTFRFSDALQYLDYMGFTTHEFFHLYNVKAIRPIELGPFDYDREVHTPMLWVSEGFTVYYETQLMLRAGIIGKDYLLNDLAGYIRETETHEGHHHMSLRQSSYDIWLNFFNTAANGQDVRISYYVKGPVLGLLFDVQLRALSQGKRSLDDLMRLLYNRFYLEKHRGFTEEEFWLAAEEVAGAPLSHLRKYVDTTEEIDYDALLAPAGLRLDKSMWKLRKMEALDKSQQHIYEAMFGK